MVVDIIIQGLSYAKTSAVCTQFPVHLKFNFPQWKTFFSVLYLINSSIRGDGISDSLYVKFQMRADLFCVNCISYFQQ